MGCGSCHTEPAAVQCDGKPSHRPNLIEIVRTDAALVHRYGLLTSMPGGAGTGLLIALLPELGGMSRKHDAALVGSPWGCVERAFRPLIGGACGASPSRAHTVWRAMSPCGSKPLRKTPGSHRSHWQTRVALDRENAAQRLSNQTPAVFSPGGFPPSTNTSFPGPKHHPLAVGPNAKSRWDTGTFALRGNVSAIWEAIRRADLPAPLAPA
jgi:hypothetical protein